MGLAVIEMAMASGFGATLSPLTHEHLFGEDQARYVVTCPAKEAAKIITQAHVASVDVIRIGTVTAARAFKIDGGPTIPIATLRTAHESWFPAYMAGEL